jgi:hypothetical protein
MPSPPVSLDDLLYWTGNGQAVPTDFDEESFELEEDGGDVLPNFSTNKGKGKRDSMYISVFESQFSHLNVSG